MNMMMAMTPIARNPGISRTVCSQPISTPVNPAASMTKLFSRADQVLNAMGIAKAITNSNATGRRQNGIDMALSVPTIRMTPAICRFNLADEAENTFKICNSV